eukprot:168230-Amphidinium_carterae.1
MTSASGSPKEFMPSVARTGVLPQTLRWLRCAAQRVLVQLLCEGNLLMSKPVSSTQASLMSWPQVSMSLMMSTTLNATIDASRRGVA